MKKYETLFFDLDHTLWDFERNSHEALTDIYEDMRLEEFGIPAPEPFITKYKEHNKRCWELYRKGEMTKEDLRSKRFKLALLDFGVVDSSLAERIGEEYVKISPYKTHLFPGTIELLDALHEDYNICIITNGFEEVQSIKIKESGLEKYFDHVVTSERAGAQKPHPDIFHLALKLSGAEAENVIMIGDDLEADVLGARKLNLDAVLFDPEGKNSVTGDFRVIRELKELRNWL